MTDPRAYIPWLLVIAGVACFAVALCLTLSSAHAAERPAVVWQVMQADGAAWRTPRGNTATATSETACGLALVEAVRFVPSGTRLQCRRIAR